MGKIKQQVTESANEPESTSYTLKDEEFTYLLQANYVRKTLIDLIGQLISSRLHEISVTRLGYDKADQLQFEIDFDDKEHQLKIAKLQTNLYKPESTEQEQSQEQKD